MTLFSRLVGFRCPNCAVLLPAFALLTTMRGGAVNIKMHDHTQCPDCSASLALNSCGIAGARVIANIVYLLGGLLLLASTLAVFSVVMSLGGFAGAGVAGLLWFFAGAFLLGALRARTLKTFVKVEIVT